MFRVLFIVLVLGAITFTHTAAQIVEENDADFLEFTDFDFDEPDSNGKSAGNNGAESPGSSANTAGDAGSSQKSQIVDDDSDDITVENDDEEFEQFDEEEFEGFTAGDQFEEPVKAADPKKAEPKITVAKVPIHYHFRTHWDSYWMELLMLVGLFVYFSNYFVGRSKNSKLANLWLNTHRSLLEENFSLIGDDGRKEGESTSGFMKESENYYLLWCSGRTCCEGMLVELKMIKRQDIVSIISTILRPVQDQIHIKVELSKDIMDTFVFCLASKKTGGRLFKEMHDLNKFCILVNKPDEKYKTPSGYTVLSEIPEATAAIIDSKLLAALNKYGKYIDYIHISDQYAGVIQQEDPNQIKQLETQRMLMCGFNILPKEDMEEMKPLLILVFYLLERLKRLRLSREAKSKAEKNRARVEEQFLKVTHTARAEAAAQKREEKRKAEKEKIMAEDDPEKQRKWEKKEQKRQAKKSQPKMKQLSIKAL